LLKNSKHKKQNSNNNQRSNPKLQRRNFIVWDFDLENWLLFAICFFDFEVYKATREDE
jgi:hypothetical protein